VNELYISECCKICGEEFTNIEDIYVDVENDDYIHLICANENKIKVVQCLEYTENE